MSSPFEDGTSHVQMDEMNALGATKTVARGMYAREYTAISKTLYVINRTTYWENQDHTGEMEKAVEHEAFLV